MLESLILFIFLIIGYYIFNFSQSLKIIKLINLSLDFIVISIIFLLGYNFSIFTNTNTIVLEVIGISLIYITIIHYLYSKIANCKNLFIRTSKG